MLSSSQDEFEVMYLSFSDLTLHVEKGANLCILLEIFGGRKPQLRGLQLQGVHLTRADL